MRALVTGAGGFCGKALCRFLENQGLEVFALSSLRDGPRVFHVSAIEDEGGIREALSKIRPEFVFHLAGVSSYPEDPWQVYRVNIGFAFHLLRAMEAAGLRDAPLLLAGSCAEYGDVDRAELPVTENHACRPLTDYGISKLAQTRLALSASRRGHRVVAARSSNALGPGIPGSLFLGSIARQVADIAKGKRQAILEVGNLDTARDFIHVDDAVRCYWKLVNQPTAFGEIVNISSGTAVPIRRLLDTLVALSGQTVSVVSRTDRMKSHDTPSFSACNRKLRALVDEAPEFQIEKTLREVLEYELTK